MLSFFAEPALKQAVRARVAEHQRLDQIVQGAYWENGRGCFIGCSLHSSEHSAFERLLGLPEWLARLGERLFEGMAPEDARAFPLSLYDAVPVGADLEPVKARFFEWLILDETHGVVRHNQDERVRAVGLAWGRIARGEIVAHDEWIALRAAAYAAADAAAADTAAYAAAADAAARRSHFKVQADKLIALMRETQPVAQPSPATPATAEFRAYYERVLAEAALQTTQE